MEDKKLQNMTTKELAKWLYDEVHNTQGTNLFEMTCDIVQKGYKKFARRIHKRIN